MFTSLFTGLVGQWFLRRAMELGGLFGTLFMFYQSLPLSTQEAIQRLSTGGWENVTLGAIVPLAFALWGYVWSFRSTVKPQIVAGGEQLPISKLPSYTREPVLDVVEAQTGRRPKIVPKP